MRAVEVPEASKPPRAAIRCVYVNCWMCTAASPARKSAPSAYAAGTTAGRLAVVLRGMRGGVLVGCPVTSPGFWRRAGAARQGRRSPR